MSVKSQRFTGNPHADVGIDAPDSPYRTAVLVGWLRFEAEPSTPGARTRTWLVSSRENGASLGRVTWYGPWRRYVFAPDAETVFEEKCLRDLAGFLEVRTAERRATWKWHRS